MGLEEVQDYANKLKKAEKMREVREQVCPLPLHLHDTTFLCLNADLFFHFTNKEINHMK